MRVAVVIPAYNEEKYIDACLDSLGKQLVPPDEIIVVDNNCHDETIAIAKKYQGIKIIKEKQQGMIYARNRGFDACDADIIARCDADTILPPDWIKKIKLNFADKQIDALTGPLVLYESPIKALFLVKAYLDIMKFLQKGAETLNGPNMIITKKIWQKVRNNVCLDDKLVHEDIDLAIHIRQAGGKIYRDNSLVIQESARRITHHPVSFFIEYPLRLIKTFKRHDISG